MKVLAIIFACLISTTFGAGIPWEPEPKDGNWMDRHNEFVRNTENNGPSTRVLFYGDSIMDFWDQEVFNEYYAPLGTANYGISADRTEHVLWRIKNGEVTDRLNTSVCVIKIGTNNIFDNDVVSIAMGITFNVLELRERVPTMKVLLLGVLPRTDEELTNRTMAINRIIQGLDNGKTIRFLDMSPHFYRDGVFVDELYIDMLHLSKAGYRKWAEVMDPLLKQMMGSGQNQ